DVDRAEVAHVVGKQRLLTTWICRLVPSNVRHRIVAVRFVDEKASRLARSPRAVDHLVPNRARVELTRHLAVAWIDEIVARPRLYGTHELVGDRDRNIEVRYLREVFLAGNEIHYVRVIDAQDTHIGPATRASLLHRVGRRIVELHERHRA